LERRRTLCTRKLSFQKRKFLQQKECFLKLIKILIIETNHLKAKLKCFYMIKVLEQGFANEKKMMVVNKP
jgi:hypothetical protein